jgi:hypothetical protein
MKHLRFQDGLDRISCLRLNSAVIVHIVNTDHGGGPQKLDNVLSSESVQNRKELTNGQKTEKVQFRV